MPATAFVTTTDIQGVTTQADNQGENRMWWSCAQSQKLINSGYCWIRGSNESSSPGDRSGHCYWIHDHPEIKINILGF